MPSSSRPIFCSRHAFVLESLRIMSSVLLLMAGFTCLKYPPDSFHSCFTNARNCHATTLSPICLGVGLPHAVCIAEEIKWRAWKITCSAVDFALFS